LRAVATWEGGTQDSHDPAGNNPSCIQAVSLEKTSTSLLTISRIDGVTIVMKPKAKAVDKDFKRCPFRDSPGAFHRDRKNKDRSVNRCRKAYLVFPVFVLLFCTILARGAYAITYGQEEELGEEFMKAARSRYVFIEDAIIVGLVSRVGDRIVDALPERIFSFHFYVIQQDVFNAFAGPAGHIFVTSALLQTLEEEEELAGILAHEIAHVACRHISAIVDQSRISHITSLAGMAVAILFALGGAGEAAGPVMSGTLAAGQSMSLTYTRENEREADRIALYYLEKSGYGGRCMLQALERLWRMHWTRVEVPAYLSTHPPTEDRVASVAAWLDTHERENSASIKGRLRDFDLVRTRLIGLSGDQHFALEHFEKTLRKQPENAMAHYGYGLALERAGHFEEAIAHMEIARLAKTPDHPILIKDLGKTYCLVGWYEAALGVLEPALRTGSYDIEAHYYLALAQLKSGRLEEAARNFEDLIKRKPEPGSKVKKEPERNKSVSRDAPKVPRSESFYSKALYDLGEVCHRQGREGESHFCLGCYYWEKRDLPNSIFHLKKALTLINDPGKKVRIEAILREAQELLAIPPRTGERGMARPF
jgi:beta-barrel assembly-enhancing protease